MRSFFDKAHGEIEQMLSDTTRLLSDLTALGRGGGRARPTSRRRCARVQLVGLAPRIVLLVAVLSNGAVEKRTIELDEDVDEVRSPGPSAHVDAHLSGRHVDELAALGPSRPRRRPTSVVAAAKTAVAGSGAGDDQVFVGGTARMAGAFEAVETVREVLGILEQQLVVVTLLRDVLDRGLTVAIGAETGHGAAGRVRAGGRPVRGRG